MKDQQLRPDTIELLEEVRKYTLQHKSQQGLSQNISQSNENFKNKQMGQKSFCATKEINKMKR